MFQFKRGIRDPRMMKALKDLAREKSWWCDVLRDPSLIIGIRDDYLNVYSRGQALLTIAFSGTRVSVTTHAKYLFNPDLDSQIALDTTANIFQVDRMEAVTREYRGEETLKRLIRAAAAYAEREKIGVQAIVVRNTKVVDVETALSDGKNVPRIDMACIDEEGSACRLIFWEAKRYGNPSLRSSSNRSVADQINKYKASLALYHDQVVDSYKIVAQNLRDIHEMSDGERPISEAVRRVAEGQAPLLLDPSDVCLLIFEFDDAQRTVIKTELEPRLRNELGISRIRFGGDPKQIQL